MSFLNINMIIVAILVLRFTLLHYFPVSYYLKGILIMSINKALEKLQKTLFRNVHERTGCKHQVCYSTLNKLLRNSDYSKSENFRKLSVMAQILSFLPKIRVSLSYRGKSM